MFCNLFIYFLSFFSFISAIFHFRHYLFYYQPVHNASITFCPITISDDKKYIICLYIAERACFLFWKPIILFLLVLIKLKYVKNSPLLMKFHLFKLTIIITILFNSPLYAHESEGDEHSIKNNTAANSKKNRAKDHSYMMKSLLRVKQAFKPKSKECRNSLSFESGKPLKGQSKFSSDSNLYSHHNEDGTTRSTRESTPLPELPYNTLPYSQENSLSPYNYSRFNTQKEVQSFSDVPDRCKSEPRCNALDNPRLNDSGREFPRYSLLTTVSKCAKQDSRKAPGNYDPELEYDALPSDWIRVYENVSTDSISPIPQTRGSTVTLKNDNQDFPGASNNDETPPICKIGPVSPRKSVSSPYFPHSVASIEYSPTLMVANNIQPEVKNEPTHHDDTALSTAVPDLNADPDTSANRLSAVNDSTNELIDSCNTIDGKNIHRGFQIPELANGQSPANANPTFDKDTQTTDNNVSHFMTSSREPPLELSSNPIELFKDVSKAASDETYKSQSSEDLREKKSVPSDTLNISGTLQSHHFPKPSTIPLTPEKENQEKPGTFASSFSAPVAESNTKNRACLEQFRSLIGPLSWFFKSPSEALVNQNNLNRTNIITVCEEKLQSVLSIVYYWTGDINLSDSEIGLLSMYLLDLYSSFYESFKKIDFYYHRLSQLKKRMFNWKEKLWCDLERGAQISKFTPDPLKSTIVLLNVKRIFCFFESSFSFEPISPPQDMCLHFEFDVLKTALMDLKNISTFLTDCIEMGVNGVVSGQNASNLVYRFQKFAFLIKEYKYALDEIVSETRRFRKKGEQLSKVPEWPACILSRNE